MVLAYELALWVVLSAGLHLYLSKKERRPVPVIAGGFAAFLGILGGAGLAGLQVFPRSAAYHDTYYTFSPNLFLIELASFYLIAGVIGLVIEKVASVLTIRLLSLAFWMFHLGASAVAFTTISAFSPVPEGKMDLSDAVYMIQSDALYWRNLTAIFGAYVAFLGALALLALLFVTLLQRFLRSRDV